MQWQWVPVALLYFGIGLFWFVAQHYRWHASSKKIADVLARLPASEQDRLAAIARSGRTIDAIKELRGTVMTDLKTARATVEGLAIFRPPRP